MAKSTVSAQRNNHSPPRKRAFARFRPSQWEDKVTVLDLCRYQCPEGDDARCADTNPQLREDEVKTTGAKVVASEILSGSIAITSHRIARARDWSLNAKNDTRRQSLSRDSSRHQQSPMLRSRPLPESQHPVFASEYLL